MNGSDGIGDTPYTISGDSNQDRYPLMDLWENVRPNKPDTPQGTESGVADETYTYWTSTIDYNEDQVYYLWDWGDGTFSEWIGPYDSGETASASHSWDKKGDYNIRVKAKDVYDFESKWSDPLPVSMPVKKGEGCLQTTQITMTFSSGSVTKNIEDIRVGDYIKSYDPINQVITPAEVIMVYEFTVDLPENYLIINNNLQVTPRHTLYINGRGWMEAGDAQIGYHMLENPLETSEINQISISSKVENQHSGDALYLQPDGYPLQIQRFRMFMTRKVRPIFPEYQPYVSRHWCAIAKLINTKLETKRFDIYDVRDWLGHTKIETTMAYVRDAKQYMQHAPYDWFKYIMKKG